MTIADLVALAILIPLLCFFLVLWLLLKPWKGHRYRLPVKPNGERLDD